MDHGEGLPRPWVRSTTSTASIRSAHRFPALVDHRDHAAIGGTAIVAVPRDSDYAGTATRAVCARGSGRYGHSGATRRWPGFSVTSIIRFQGFVVLLFLWPFRTCLLQHWHRPCFCMRSFLFLDHVWAVSGVV